MIFKLALRNITSKPLRACATVFAVAVAVAMIFSMLSVSDAVYSYILGVETADAGNSDVIVTYDSDSDRIIGDKLEHVEGVEFYSPVLSLYALYNGEYVRVRGFDSAKIDLLNKIEVVDGDLGYIKEGSQNFSADRVAVSEAAAKHYGLSVDDEIRLSLGDSGNMVHFYVGVIAENNGYFLDDSPFVIIGGVKQVSSFLDGFQARVYNEIYIKAETGADINAIIGQIKQIPEYENMLVEPSKDDSYIQEQVNGLTAPIVISGAAVVFLALASVIMLFMIGSRDRVNYISKLSVVGASRKQIFGVFVIENAILAVLGAIIGLALASGVFYALIKLTLGAVFSFSVSAAKLIGAAVLGAAITVAAGMIPLVKAFGDSVRENQLATEKRTVARVALPLAALLATTVCVVLEFTLSGLKGAMSAVNLALAMFTLCVCVGSALGLGARAIKKSPSAVVGYAAVSVIREKRFSRSAVMLTAGMTISILLFMAWQLTTSVFNAYISEFDNMIFVSNVPSDADVSEFRTDGINGATKLVWRTADVVLNADKGKTDKTLNVFGSEDLIDMVDFDYVTPRDEIKRSLLSGDNAVVLDIALHELYGINTGDKVSVFADGNQCDYTVAGFVASQLFGGNYIIASRSALDNGLGLKPDTVLCVADGNIDAAIGALKSKFAEKNYYVVDVLEAYRWESSSLQSVFDLIGVLAVVVSLFIFGAACASVISGRISAERERETLLLAGMSKNMLLRTEIIQHVMVAVIAFAIAVASSVLFTALLINALRLFGLYFTFMYDVGTAFAVGAVFTAAYCIMPFALRYKKGYNMKRQ